ncbi:hypothetical protein Pelo_16483 [Pelomyxa schiedti]|nr:hypothetical protein Pelo_16483 [Pelomyxa schiedti]
MIYLHKAKRQWAQDNAGASQFEIALFASMVESHSVTVSNANSYEGVTETMLDHVGFALGSFLISKERPELPKECTVQQYIDRFVWFRTTVKIGVKWKILHILGARTLAKLCHEKASTPLVIRFVVLFVVNLVLSVGTVVYWASSIGGLVTVGIGIYLHWFYCSVLFAWKTPYLTASAMVFGIYGGMFSVVGFSFALTCNDSLFWYRYWYGWGLWQFVYMVSGIPQLSLFGIENTPLFHCQFRVMTSHSVVAWILIGIYVPIFIVLIIVGLVLFNWHAVQVVGFTVLCCLFVLPALFIFIVMAAQVFPKRVSIPGLIVSLVLVISSGVAAVGFGLTGEWNVVVTTS